MTYVVSPEPSLWPLDWNHAVEPGGVTSGSATTDNDSLHSLNLSVPNVSVVRVWAL